MKIQECYDKYKHLDRLLSTPKEEFTLFIMTEFWLSIKDELGIKLEGME